MREPDQSAHLLQQIEFASFEPDEAKCSLGPSAFGLGTIADHLPRLDCLGRWRHNPTGINPGDFDVMTSRGTNQTQITPKAHSVLQGSQPTREPERRSSEPADRGRPQRLPRLPGRQSPPGEHGTRRARIRQHHNWTCTTAPFALHRWCKLR